MNCWLPHHPIFSAKALGVAPNLTFYAVVDFVRQLFVPHPGRWPDLIVSGRTWCRKPKDAALSLTNSYGQPTKDSTTNPFDNPGVESS